MSYDVEYFNQRVLDEIERWPQDVRADYFRLVGMVIEHGPDLRLPHSRAMGAGLFELRPRGSSGIARALYCFLSGKRVVIVHAFVKKTQQTSNQDLKVALRRVQEIRNG